MQLKTRNGKFINIDAEEIKEDFQYYCHTCGGKVYEKAAAMYYLYNLCFSDFLLLIETVLDVTLVLKKRAHSYSVVSADVVAPYYGLYGRGIKIIKPVIGDRTHKAECYYYTEEEDYGAN